MTSFKTSCKTWVFDLEAEAGHRQKKCLEQVIQTVNLPDNTAQVFSTGVLAFEFLITSLGQGLDAGQGIFDFMGDATGQNPLGPPSGPCGSPRTASA